MTDSAQPGELASLEPLEPLDSGNAGGSAAGPGGPGTDDLLLQAARAGLAPAYNPYCRDKAFYRFLFAGVMIVVGCLMPFTAEIGRAGYQTMSGAIYLLIGIAMVWSWWASIATNRPVTLKWVGYALIPMGGVLMNIVAFDVEAARKHAIDLGWLKDVEATRASANWKAMFADIGGALAKDSDAAARVEHFWRLFGPGQFFLFLGAMVALLAFVGGVVGGAKKNKADKKAAMLAVTERKRR